jgi:hypothetical protein
LTTSVWKRYLSMRIRLKKVSHSEYANSRHITIQVVKKNPIFLQHLAKNKKTSYKAAEETEDSLIKDRSRNNSFFNRV